MKRLVKQSDLPSSSPIGDVIVGIDLSTKEVGVVVMQEEGDVIIEKKTVNFGGWKNFYNSYRGCTLEDVWVDVIEYHFGFIKELWDLRIDNGFENSEIKLVIELSNFSDPSMTQKFAWIASLIVDWFKRNIENFKDFKIVNANEWFKHLVKKYPKEFEGKVWTQIKREERKKLSTKLSKIKDDNQADAYWMIHFYYYLSDMWSGLEKDDE